VVTMQRKALLITGLTVLSLFLTACGFGPLGSNTTPTPFGVPGMTTLWPDVPEFEGAKAAMDTNGFVNQAQSKMMIMTYTTDKAPADVASFYSNERMQARGWNPQPYHEVDSFSFDFGESSGPSTGSTNGGCALASLHDQPAAFCSFSKIDAQGRNLQLAINITLDTKASRTSIHYVRMTGSSSQK
jgi:hypothetical protein